MYMSESKCPPDSQGQSEGQSDNPVQQCEALLYKFESITCSGTKVPANLKVLQTDYADHDNTGAKGITSAFFPFNNS